MTAVESPRPTTRTRPAVRPPSAAPAAPAPGTTAPVATERVSVVIPAKNEAGSIAWVLRRIPDWVDEVIVVDGLSRDRTLEIARACRPDVVVVHESRPGKGAAIRAGFAAARGDIVVMLDADGSMDPGEIGAFADAIRAGADLAKGTRRADGGGSADITPIRDAGNLGLLVAANLLFRTRFSELCYGFMALRRNRIPELALVGDGFEIETEIVLRAVRCGHRITEVPSFEAPRRAGQSNLHAVRDGLRILRTMLRVRLSGRSSRRAAETPADARVA